MYLIIGSGYLGNYIIQNLKKETKEQILATYHSDISKNDTRFHNVKWVQFDMADILSIDNLYDIVKKYKNKGEKIKCFYTAGYIKPDDCEKNAISAIDKNINSISNFLGKFNDIIEDFIFTSTDFVYGESKNDYKFTELDVPHPETIYGAIKYACERIVISFGYNVVRLPFMFGPSLNANRPHFFEHIFSTINEKKVFEVLSDYYESSLDYDTVSKIMIRLMININKSNDKIFNIAADKKISKYNIALGYLGHSDDFNKYIKPLKLENATFFVAKRCSILMDNSKIKNFLGLNTIEINFKGDVYED